MNRCSNCRSKKIFRRNRCRACHTYYERHKSERPETLWWRDLGRYQKSIKPNWCKNCGRLKIKAYLRCNACHHYFTRNKKERPSYIWNKDYCCDNCGIPLRTTTRRKSFCNNCYVYKNRTQKSRPKTLWGIGSLGWCDCGRGAWFVEGEFAVCALHREKK
jgi:hypothetical protein